MNLAFRIAHLKQAIASQIKTDPKSVVILCDGQAVSQSAPIQEVFVVRHFIPRLGSTNWRRVAAKFSSLIEWKSRRKTLTFPIGRKSLVEFIVVSVLPQLIFPWTPPSLPWIGRLIRGSGWDRSLPISIVSLNWSFALTTISECFGKLRPPSRCGQAVHTTAEEPASRPPNSAKKSQ